LLRLLGLLKGLCVAGKIWLRLARAVWRFARGSRPQLCVVLAFIEALVARALALAFDPSEMRIVLAKLLLCRCNHAVVMLGMLIIILGRNGISGRLRITRQLNVFFRDMSGIPAYLYVRPVRLEDARHWIVALAMVVAPAHPFVLTVSHDFPAANPFYLTAPCHTPSLAKEPMLSLASDAAKPALSPPSRGDKSAALFRRRFSFLVAKQHPPPYHAALPTSFSRACPPRLRTGVEPMKHLVPL
jgi:hypothetical protein